MSSDETSVLLGQLQSRIRVGYGYDWVFKQQGPTRSPGLWFAGAQE